MTTCTKPMRLLKSLLVIAVAYAVALSMPRTTAEMMMDMPSDPVNGKMVMSTTHNFQLQNGQNLRFVSAETLHQFTSDPSSGLGEITMGDSSAATSSATTAALCPVCGMETAAHGGPQVAMKHGEQAIRTCSMFHAHQVHDDIRSVQAAPSNSDNAASGSTTSDEGAAFCTGPGTTMLNGFSFFSHGMATTTPCLILWFPGWLLNTSWKYVLGCCVVVLCAMMNEYLLQIRRLLRKESNAKKHALLMASTTSEATKLLAVRPRAYSASYVPAASSGRIATWFRGLSGNAQHTVHCLLHGLTIALAYMLMLVSMTYDGVLFLCCIFGYIVGYYVFGERREAVTEMDTLSFAS